MLYLRKMHLNSSKQLCCSLFHHLRFFNQMQTDKLLLQQCTPPPLADAPLTFADAVFGCVKTHFIRLEMFVRSREKISCLY